MTILEKMEADAEDGAEFDTVDIPTGVLLQLCAVARAADKLTIYDAGKAWFHEEPDTWYEEQERLTGDLECALLPLMQEWKE